MADAQQRRATQDGCDGRRAHGAHELRDALGIRRRGRHRREGPRFPNQGVGEHHGRDLRRVDGRLRLGEPVRQPIDRRAVPDDERRLQPGQRVRDVARGRRHRGCEHDDVRARLAEQRVRALAVGIGRQRPGVDDVEVAREQLGVPARRLLAVLPEAWRHLLLEEREVARDDVRPSAGRRQSRCQSSP